MTTLHLASGSSSSIGLLVALGAFIAIVAWVFWFVPAASWRADAQIPLDDDASDEARSNEGKP